MNRSSQLVAVLVFSALVAIPGCGKMSPKGESVGEAPPAGGTGAAPSALPHTMTVNATASIQRNAAGAESAGIGVAPIVGVTPAPSEDRITADTVAAHRDAFFASLKSATPSA